MAKCTLAIAGDDDDGDSNEDEEAAFFTQPRLSFPSAVAHQSTGAPVVRDGEDDDGDADEDEEATTTSLPPAVHRVGSRWQLRAALAASGSGTVMPKAHSLPGLQLGWSGVLIIHVDIAFAARAASPRTRASALRSLFGGAKKKPMVSIHASRRVLSQYSSVVEGGGPKACKYCRSTNHTSLTSP